MPEYIWSQEHNSWVKKCLKCMTLYIADREDQSEAESTLALYFRHSEQCDDGFYPYCKQCETNRIRGRENINGHHTLERQGGKCDCCGEEISFMNNSAQTDHDHKTGRTRGIVCRGCNHRIERMENQKFWQNVADYLDKWKKIHEDN